MIRATINIGLFGPKNVRGKMSWVRRLKLSLAWLHENHGASVRFMHPKTDSVAEPTVVGLVEVPDAMWAGFVDDLAKFTAAIEQDCVAMVYWNKIVKAETGYLIGPRPFMWGDFDPALFVTWEQACASSS